LAAVAAIWAIYGLTGPLLRLPRVRVSIGRRTGWLLAASGVLLVLMNWVYLVLDGR